MRLAQLRMTLAVGIAVVLMAWVTRPLYGDILYVTNAAMVVGATLLPGLLVRLVWPRSRALEWPSWLLEVAGGAGMLWWLHRGHPLAELVRGALEQIREGTAPLPASPHLSLLFLLLPFLAAALCDLLVHVGRLAGAVVVPLGAWFVLLALVPYPQAGWTSVVAVGVGIALVLAADTAARGRSWRSAVASDSGRGGGDVDATVARLALTLVVPALALSLALGWLLPTFNRHEISSTDGSVAMGDPRLDLRQNLHASSRAEVLTYRTTGGSADVAEQGVRLRLAVLSDLSDDGWNVAPFPSKRLDGPRMELPPVPGLGLPGVGRRTQVQIGTFPSQYLPLPYAPRVVEAEGQWGRDDATLMVYTVDDRGRDITNHLAYTVSSLDVVPDAAALDRATSTGSGDAPSGVPAAFPDSLRRLTQEVVGTARTPLQKASAIQAFLRSPEFVYDLDRAPTQGGFAGLEQFLLVERVGYCEQYASAFAAMARAAGMPSRVVIGFLPGDQREDGTWSVANLNMHAWPEVWFDGYGWLPFEPTPAQVSGEVPPYTLQEGDSTPTPTPTPTSASPTPKTASAQPTVVPDEPAAPVKVTRDGTPWGLLAGLGGAVVALLVLAMPAWYRRTLRERRLRLRDTGGEKTMALWHEVRDTVLDLGGDWPQDSPRAIAAHVGVGLDESVRDGLQSLAVAVERVRFGAAPGQVPRDAIGTVMTVREVLQRAAGRGQQLAAAWWPHSLWVSLGHRLRRGRRD